jgi:hypothetical protein
LVSSLGLRHHDSFPPIPVINQISAVYLLPDLISLSPSLPSINQISAVYLLPDLISPSLKLGPLDLDRFCA